MPLCKGNSQVLKTLRLAGNAKHSPGDSVTSDDLQTAEKRVVQWQAKPQK